MTHHSPGILTCMFSCVCLCVFERQRRILCDNCINTHVSRERGVSWHAHTLGVLPGHCNACNALHSVVLAHPKATERSLRVCCWLSSAHTQFHCTAAHKNRCQSVSSCLWRRWSELPVTVLFFELKVWMLWYCAQTLSKGSKTNSNSVMLWRDRSRPCARSLNAETH